VKRDGVWRPFQEFMIVDHAEGKIEEVAFHGAAQARLTQETRSALRSAEVIVVGPSNPVVSIGPILQVQGMREALKQADAPVVAVSPFVGGRAVKGPTDAFCQWAGIALGAQGIVEAYGDYIDGVVADEEAEGVPVLRTDTLMATPAARARLARTILDFAGSL
jgi:LPPG:FO 2-phospho-L-lactate transferase